MNTAQFFYKSCRLRNLITLFLLIIMPTISMASAIHHTTDTVSEHRTAPQSLPGEKDFAWIYTKRAADNKMQVFVQFLHDMTPPVVPLQPFIEHQLTFGGTDKLMPRWGESGAGVSMTYYADPTAAPVVCAKGYLFYYITNDDSKASTELQLGCFNKSAGNAPAIVFSDAPLTDYSTLTPVGNVTHRMRVKDYDVSFDKKLPNIGSEIEFGYYVAFTDKDNHLHMLVHDKDVIYGDREGVLLKKIVYDYENSSDGYFWTSFVAQQKSFYSQVRFDRIRKRRLTFLLGSPSSPYHQVGTADIKGAFNHPLLYDLFLTKIERDKTQPQFVPNSLTDILFEYPETAASKGQIAHIVMDNSLIPQVCDTVNIISEPDFTRHQLNLQSPNPASGLPPANPNVNIATYARTQNDGMNDIYATRMDLKPCATPNFIHSGAPKNRDIFTITSNPVGKTYAEIQETCTHDNQFPQLLNFYLDAAVTSPTPGPLEFYSIIAINTDLSVSQNFLQHIYDTEIEVDIANCGSCTETANGDLFSPSEDSDGNGILDSCESTPSLLCTPHDLLANPTLDFDNDGINNENDCCPCTINYNQLLAPEIYDRDGDGVCNDVQGIEIVPGDGPVFEGGCDICPNLDNPANVDTNGDGQYDVLDGDTRQALDVDCDGVPDCGTTDVDGDGIFDNCDNCLVIQNNDQADEDADGIGDACEGTGTIIKIIDPTVNPPVTSPLGEAESVNVPQFNMWAQGGACSCNLIAQSGSNSLLALLVALTGLMIVVLRLKSEE